MRWGWSERAGWRVTESAGWCAWVGPCVRSRESSENCGEIRVEREIFRIGRGVASVWFSGGVHQERGGTVQGGVSSA